MDLVVNLLPDNIVIRGTNKGEDVFSDILS